MIPVADQVLSLHIDHVVLSAPPERAEDARKVLQSALQRVGQRLADLPAGQRARLGQATLAHLDLGQLSPTQLLGPDGARLLADRLYDRLIEETR